MAWQPMNVRITGGTHRGRTLRSSSGGGLRPTSDRVRSAIFSILGWGAASDVRVLDLYAGTGILGIESLSRGAAWVDFVEVNPRRCRQLRENLRELGLQARGEVYAARVERLPGSLSEPYGLVFADPPYDTAPWPALMSGLSERGLVAENGVVVAEHRRTTALAERYGNLTQEDSRRYGDTSVSFYRAGVSSG